MKFLLRSAVSSPLSGRGGSSDFQPLGGGEDPFDSLTDPGGEEEKKGVPPLQGGKDGAWQGFREGVGKEEGEAIQNL